MPQHSLHRRYQDGKPPPPRIPATHLIYAPRIAEVDPVQVFVAAINEKGDLAFESWNGKLKGVVLYREDGVTTWPIQDSDNPDVFIEGFWPFRESETEEPNKML